MRTGHRLPLCTRIGLIIILVGVSIVSIGSLALGAAKPKVKLVSSNRLATASATAKACVKAKVGTITFNQIVSGKKRPTAAQNTIIARCDSQSANESNQSNKQSLSSQGSDKQSLSSQGSDKQSLSSQGSDKSNPSHTRKPEDDIFPEVWTKNGYDGESYEFKVNCGSKYEKLEECFLWDLTNVTVTTPDKITYELNKDFNINSYSGEVTRRWVLYGPGGGGLPTAGRYRFTYIRGSLVTHFQDVNYTPEIVDPPANIRLEKSGNQLKIFWDPPAGINSTMWYKPSIDPPGNERQIISKVIAWDQSSATLENPPVSTGEPLEVNVAVFFRGGYAYPKPLLITW